jgi:hypothetical protein
VQSDLNIGAMLMDIGFVYRFQTTGTIEEKIFQRQ